MEELWALWHIFLEAHLYFHGSHLRYSTFWNYVAITAVLSSLSLHNNFLKSFVLRLCAFNLPWNHLPVSPFKITSSRLVYSDTCHLGLWSWVSGEEEIWVLGRRGRLHVTVATSLFKVRPALSGVGDETLRKGGEGTLVERKRRHPFLPINLTSSSQLDFCPLFILDAHVTCVLEEVTYFWM